MLTKSAEDFWSEVEQQFSPAFRCHEPIIILSPRQNRKYALGLSGLKKFSYIKAQMKSGFLYCPLPKELFEKHFITWATLGVLTQHDLEEEYKKRLPPDFMAPISLDKVILDLEQLIQKKELTARFAELWSTYIRMQFVRGYIEELKPYEGFTKSFQSNNDQRIVERYIYALWLKRTGYKGGRDKKNIGYRLYHCVLDAIENNPGADNIEYLKGIVSDKKSKNPNKQWINRTLTDMTYKEIQEYLSDGFLTEKDFPELFSAS